MMLDQQYPMEHAFRGPAKVLDRFGTLDPAAIAAADPEEFAACSPPAGDPPLPGLDGREAAVAGARIVAEEYDGDATGSGPRPTDGKDLLERLLALPGFGKQKAQIFVALLAKQLGVRPEGWEQAAGDYAEEGYRSVADVVDPASLQKVRDFKKAKKAEAALNRRLTCNGAIFRRPQSARESASGLRAGSHRGRGVGAIAERCQRCAACPRLLGRRLRVLAGTPHGAFRVPEAVELCFVSKV